MNVLSMNLFQPLLRGFGKNDPSVEALTQAERNVVYAIRDYSQFQREFAVGIVNDYFGLLGQKDVVRNNYTNYLRRVESTKYLEARSVDRQSRSQVDDARTSELGARISYINSVASYLSQLDAFKITLGLPLNEAIVLDDVDLEEFDQRFKAEISALTRNLTVYVSSNDRALFASRLINRSMRLGESSLDPSNPGLVKQATKIIGKLYDAFVMAGASMAEINPLIVDLVANEQEILLVGRPTVVREDHAGRSPTG